MRCEICNFCQATDEPTGNKVFLHEGREICQECFDISQDALIELSTEDVAEPTIDLKTGRIETTVPKSGVFIVRRIPPV